MRLQASPQPAYISELVEGQGESDLRFQLRACRTEIAMAIHDPFPLLYGLADHDIISEKILCETLEQKKKDGIHKAVYFLLTLLLDQDAAVLKAFWSNLYKKYNKECYPKLETLLMNLPQRTKAGVQAVSTSVQIAVTVSANEHPTGCRTMEGIIIQQVIESGGAKKCIKVGGEFYSSGKLDETCGGHKTQTADNYSHQQGELSTRAIDHNDDECVMCKFGGELICCDGCPCAFLVPPLTSVPSGTWLCQLCHSSRAKEKTYTLLQPIGLQVQLSHVTQFLMVGIRVACGICHLARGEMITCPQCQSYHNTQQFLRSKTKCRNCSRTWGSESETPSRSLQVTQHMTDQSSAPLEQLLNKVEMSPLGRAL
ncbi:autoimmune regulator-like [Xyrauchen texanus]|uniref:autoimmune regulator-like n=1 Tax=Xyrauchen texanus TaxID=154827 RepID=UPI0022426E32|nr:autoimmune regulator-like [Xyrauchen texanus]